MTQLGTVPFEKKDRAGFVCENEKINTYFANRLSQDLKRGLDKCFVLRSPEPGQPIDGFYTLKALSIDLSQVPEDRRAKLPGYPQVPVILIVWLARHRDRKRSGVGELLLMDALKRAAAADVGAYAVIADAIDHHAGAFYAKYEFIKLDGARYMLEMQTIKKLR